LASSVQSEKKLGVHSSALQSTLPAGVQSQCLFSRNWSEVKCTPFFLDYIGRYSPFLVIFGVLRLLIHKNWSSHGSTPYYWSKILQQSNIFGVPVHHSQNVGVHIVNLCSALRLFITCMWHVNSSQLRGLSHILLYIVFKLITVSNE
jgi:hypothetical protein